MRRTVHDYFVQAMRRGRGTRCKTLVFDRDGNCAGFALEAFDGRIHTAGYRATTCATLVALCEHLAELALGMTLQEATSLEAQCLLALHPEIPPSRYDRAGLVVAAFRAALESISQGVKH